MDEEKRRAVRARMLALGLPEVDDALAHSIAQDVERMERAAADAARAHDFFASSVDFAATLERLRR
jgi:hypothetical protein